MTLTEYIQLLNLSSKQIDEMPSERAKEILKVVVAILNEEREKPSIS